MSARREGNFLRKTFTTALMTLFCQAFVDVAFPTQLGNEEKAGGSQLVFGIQTLLKANYGHVALTLDMENAFNEPEFRTQAFNVHCGDITESFITNSTRLPHRGVIIYGVPIGSPGNVSAFLDDCAEKIASNIATACANMHSREATVLEVLGRQYL